MRHGELHLEYRIDFYPPVLFGPEGIIPGTIKSLQDHRMNRGGGPSESCFRSQLRRQTVQTYYPLDTRDHLEQASSHKTDDLNRVIFLQPGSTENVGDQWAGDMPCSRLQCVELPKVLVVVSSHAIRLSSAQAVWWRWKICPKRDIEVEWECQRRGKGEVETAVSVGRMELR